jgi:trimethylamine--corrinoid protein Co-methyltransferase
LENELEIIHKTALKILKEVGVKLYDPEILDLVQQKGVKVTGETAFFEPEQVMQWIGKAPEAFTLHARNPRYDMHIGGDNVECAAGYGCPAIIEADGTRRDALLQDYVTFAKLVHQSEHFKINGGILAQPSDVDAAQSHLIMLYAAIVLSDKGIVGIPGSGKNMQQIMDMMAILFGGKEALMEKPHVLTMISTISPLRIDEIALQSILVAARHNQPLIMSPAPATGTTGPISIGANLALATAEALCGVVVAQMVREGTPVIFGLQCYGADLKTGNISIGSPAYALQAGFCARLARMYKLPSRGGGTTNDAKAVSVQSGYESMMSMLTAYQNGISLIFHSAGILDSFAAISYEQFMVDLEIIGMIKFYLRGLDAETAEDFSIDVIKEVGAGGQFLTTSDTLSKCRTYSWNPDISLRGRLTARTAEEQILERAQKKQAKMLGSYERPHMDPTIRKRLDEFMTRAGVDVGVLETIHGER